MNHGHPATYRGSARCRCQLCREANRAYGQTATAERSKRLAANPTLVPHGRESTYSNWGCRCESCTAAHSAVMKARRARLKERASR